MTNRAPLACFIALAATLGTVAPMVFAAPAAAQNAREYQYQRNVPNTCPRGLKLAAGACVRRCPAGYQDMGRQCRLRNLSRGV
jgi:hypothetical protein